MRFVRTPEGRGVGVVREGGEGGGGEVWVVEESSSGNATRLRRGPRWRGGDEVVVLNGGMRPSVHFFGGQGANHMCTTIGKNVATYSSADHMLTLHLESGPPAVLPLPELTSLFSLPSSFVNHESIIAITSSLSIIHITYSPSSTSLQTQIQTPTHVLTQHAHRILPTTSSAPTTMVLPVDPMAWSAGPTAENKNQWGQPHDVLLSVSEEGELAFWVFDEGVGTSGSQWRCTGRVRTGRRGFSRARCSSSKKSALGMPFPILASEFLLTSFICSCSGTRRRRAYYLGFKGIGVCFWAGVPHSFRVILVASPLGI